LVLAQGELRGEVVKLSKPVVPAARPGDKDGPPYAHPYYWAAFILLGDPD
jgi:CHAT domain-containing protein